MLGIRGVLTPNITPFTPNGEIYEEGLRRHVAFILEKGVKGHFVTGSYGSGPMMDSNKRKKVAEIVVDETSGRAKTIGMIGTASTDESIKLSKHAEDIGANAIASVVPYYYSSFMYDDDIIVDYFKQLVTAVDVPVHFYNNPRTTGFAASPQLLGKLIEAGVTGMKDSSGNIVLLTDFLSEIEIRQKPFEYIVGTSSIFLTAHMLGIKACISGVSNAFPELIVGLFNALEKGDYQKAAELQRFSNKVRNLLGLARNKPAACYAVLKMRGIDVGTVKKPWRALTREEYNTLQGAIERLGVYERIKLL